MSIWVYKLNKNHEQICGIEPRSLYYILLCLFDKWNIHPLRPEFISSYQLLSDKEKFRLRKEFVEEFPITDDLDGIAPKTHFEQGVHRSWRLIEYLPRDKEIKVPCIVFINDKKPYVYEGHHRAGAAKLLGWKTIPSLVLNGEGTAPGYSGMTNKDRVAMQEKQSRLGLSNTSRIHGMKIVYWSEKELRTFMVPRPNDSSKYHMRSLDITECDETQDSKWDNIEKGITIKVHKKVFKLPWKIKNDF